MSETIIPKVRLLPRRKVPGVKIRIVFEPLRYRQDATPCLGGGATRGIKDMRHRGRGRASLACDVANRDGHLASTQLVKMPSTTDSPCLAGRLLICFTKSALRQVLNW